MNIANYFIHHTAEICVATIGIFGVALAEVVQTYTQTVITVFGEIVIACITGYCLIKVAQLKDHINSRMDELLKLTKAASKAEGVIEGRAAERATVAAVAKGIADSKQE